MKVIINADDFGYSETVNESIVKLMEAGRVTSATIMANGGSFSDAVKLTKQFPQCSFGIHLVLTELAPLQPAAVFNEAGMMDSQGRFNSSIRSIKPSWRLREAVYAEWQQQVRRVLSNGIEISHFDSHHHVHTIPWLFWPLKRLQREFGIKRVRSSLNWYFRSEVVPSRMLLLKKRCWNTAIRHWPRTKSPNYFTSFEWFVKNMTVGEARSGGVAELMVHPGQPYSVEETSLLWADWQARIPTQLQLINYREF